MSALGSLLIVIIGLLALEIIGVAALLLVKNEKAYKIIFVLLALLTMAISYMGATSLPTNYIFAQIIEWAWGAMAIIALVLQFYAKGCAKYAKYLLLFATIAGIIDLILM